ncbi:calponin homology domain-containing protein [Zychaea mexicana]|uniref:calponin domain-containing protein n=1 Tax=Zychaea mexicana TaxID=64656 RepID=UPI0022FDC80B|nr:calponin domain-containing protein [Zychaea mexicana]KAI9498895.1 calponin homology domain-containing protein [Zychaea mexicana]
MKLTNSISTTRRHGRQHSNNNNNNNNNNSGSSSITTSSNSNNNHNSHEYPDDAETSRNLSIDYQEIQKRTLTKWVNAQLVTADDHIENMETDLRDGKRLLKLLSVVSKEPAPKPERGNMRIHQLSNVARALGFLKEQLGEVPDVGNEAIVNGDLKKTLALIYFVMLKYHVHLILDDKSIMSLVEVKSKLIPSNIDLHRMIALMCLC